MITLDTITLPEDLWWQDEIEWTPVQQSVEFSTTGALLIDLAVKLAGQPITLVGDDTTAWISRGTALDLQALAAVPGQTMTLIIHDRSFEVVFSYSGKPVDVDPVVRICPPENGDYYIVKGLRFLVISENL